MKTKNVSFLFIVLLMVSMLQASDSSIPLRVCIEENKIETIDNSVEILESKVDLALESLCAADSKIDVITLTSQTIFSKICLIDSKVDFVALDVISIESHLDVINVTILDADSKVDFFDSVLDSAILTICSIESNVDILVQEIRTIDSFIDVIDDQFDTIESKIDNLNSLIDFPIAKACTLISKIDVINSIIDLVQEPVDTIDSKLDTIDNNFGTIDSLLDVSQTTLFIINSFVDVTDSVADIILEKSCTIESRVDVIDSKVDIVLDLGETLESYLEELAVDFQETWTILQFIEDKACIISNTLTIVYSKVDSFSEEFFVDLLGTTTMLADIQSKVDATEVIIQTAEMKLDNGSCTTQADLDGTFTMLNAMISKTVKIGSKADIFVLDIADIVDNYGIPIRQVNVDFLGYDADQKNRYFNAEYIAYEPTEAGTAAIYIVEDNIELNGLRRAMDQVNTYTGTSAVRVAAGVRGLYVTDLSMSHFTGNAVEVLANTSDLFFLSLNIKSAGQSGMDFVQSASTVLIRDCIIGQCSANGISANSSSDIVIEECMVTDNGLSTTNSGIYILNCDRTLIKNTMATGNMGCGFDIRSTTTQTEAVVNKCKAFENGLHGICMSHVADSVIKNSISNENGGDGIHLNDCTNVEVIFNYCSDNTDDNIVLGTESTGSRECYVGENSLLLTGSVSVREEGGSGPNSILSNFSLAGSSGNNYVTESGATYLNLVTVDQGGSFPATPPNKWYNINMTT